MVMTNTTVVVLVLGACFMTWLIVSSGHRSRPFNHEETAVGATGVNLRQAADEDNTRSFFDPNSKFMDRIRTPDGKAFLAPIHVGSLPLFANESGRSLIIEVDASTGPKSLQHVDKINYILSFAPRMERYTYFLQANNLPDRRKPHAVGASPHSIVLPFMLGVEEGLKSICWEVDCCKQEVRIVPVITLEYVLRKLLVDRSVEVLKIYSKQADDIIRSGGAALHAQVASVEVDLPAEDAHPAECSKLATLLHSRGYAPVAPLVCNGGPLSARFVRGAQKAVASVLQGKSFSSLLLPVVGNGTAIITPLHVGYFPILPFVPGKRILIEIGVNSRNSLQTEAHPNDYVLSFEPLLDKYAVYLNAGYDHHTVKPVSIGARPNGVIFPFAVGPSAGMMTFNVAPTDGCSSLLPPTTGAGWDHWVSQTCAVVAERRIVPVISLEFILKELVGGRPVHFLKVDAQGYDHMVIHSGGEALHAQVEAFVVEMVGDLRPPLYHGQPQCTNVTAQFEKLGFPPDPPLPCAGSFEIEARFKRGPKP